MRWSFGLSWPYSFCWLCNTWKCLQTTTWGPSPLMMFDQRTVATTMTWLLMIVLMAIDQRTQSKQTTCISTGGSPLVSSLHIIVSLPHQPLEVSRSLVGPFRDGCSQWDPLLPEEYQPFDLQASFWHLVHVDQNFHQDFKSDRCFQGSAFLALQSFCFFRARQHDYWYKSQNKT